MQIAEAAKAKIPGAVTEIAQLTTFYPAESYHQQYLENVRKPAFKNDAMPVLLLSLLCCFLPALFARRPQAPEHAPTKHGDTVEHEWGAAEQGGRGGRAQSARKECNDPIRCGLQWRDLLQVGTGMR